MEDYRQCVENKRHYSASQGYGLPSGHIELQDLDGNEGRTPKSWCLLTVVLEKTLRVPWTARSWNKSILREISPEYSLEGLMLKLNSSILVTWCEQLARWKSPWCWERLRAEGEEGIRGWDGWLASPIQRIWTWANFGSWWGTGRPGVLQSMGSQRVRYDWATEQQHGRGFCYNINHEDAYKNLRIVWKHSYFKITWKIIILTM